LVLQKGISSQDRCQRRPKKRKNGKETVPYVTKVIVEGRSMRLLGYHPKGGREKEVYLAAIHENINKEGEKA